MLELCDALVTVARSPAATILLRGATGTGKEIAARVLHGESSRASAPFVAVNCTAGPATLLEDMFFGHDAGAFTDATSVVVGFIVALANVNAQTASDVNAIGGIVGSLIEGMGIALYTTLVGSVLNLWLAANYQLLATGTANLAAALIDAGHA